MKLKQIIKEELTKTDEREIGIMIRKEIKNAFGNDLERKVKEIVAKEIKGKPFEKEVVEITKDVMEKLYRELWMKRSVWRSAIS